MSDRGNGFGVGFSKSVEAILATIQLGAAMQEVYLYPHEVRENLRLAGMRLDKKIAQLPDPWNPPENHEPEFTDPVDPDDTPYDPEEEVNA